MLDKPHEPIHKMLPCFVPIPKKKRKRKRTNRRKNPLRKEVIPIIVISSQFIGRANPVQIHSTSPFLTGCCIPPKLNLKEPEAER